MSHHAEIRRAEFNPKVCTYWLLSGIIGFTVSIIGIPFLLLWIPLGLLVTRNYLSKMECVLTDNALKVKKGILVRVEKTIPLEKITDMGMVQGPIMRMFDLHTLSVETAGQSGAGALVSLTGIVDAKSFREAVLNQRDLISSSTQAPIAKPVSLPGGDSVALLCEIKETLVRIESLLEETAKRS